MNNNLDEVLEDSFFLQMHNIQIFRKEQDISLSADLTQTLGAPQMCPYAYWWGAARNGSGDTEGTLKEMASDKKVCQ